MYSHFLFSQQELQATDSDFDPTSDIMHLCYTVIPNSTTSGMSHSSIKITAMTHTNSFGVKLKSEGTSK